MVEVTGVEKRAKMKIAGNVALGIFGTPSCEGVVTYRLWSGKVYSIPATEAQGVVCTRCNKANGASVLYDPLKGPEKMWFCLSDECLEKDKSAPKPFGC